ncbi:MAG: histidine kinase [Saprospiraceae bacterium]|nr:histidine kinase [Saprospiraceae bacterium]
MQISFFNKKYLKPSREVLNFFALTLLFFLLAHSISAQIPHFRQHPLSIENAEQLELNCLAQSPNGVMWLGSNRGLIRYNGLQMQLFPTQSPVTALFSNAKRGLWIGFENGEIAFFYKNQINIWQREEGLPKVKITGFAEDTNGNFWFSTYGEGAYCYDGIHLYNFNTDDGLTGNEIYAIAKNAQGQILLATDNGISFCQFSQGKKTVWNESSSENLPDLIVKALSQTPTNEVFAGFYNGAIGSVTQKNWVKVQGVVSTASCFDKSNVVVGTEDNGLFFIDLQHGRIDKVPNNLQISGQSRGSTLGGIGRRIQATFIDTEGNIWVISDKNKLFSANYRFLTYKTNLTDIQAIATLNTHEILLGTKEGAFNYNIKTGQIQRFLPKKINVISLFNHFGIPFIGTYGSGLFMKKPNEVNPVHFSKLNGLSNLNIFSVATRDDTLWVASLSGFFRILQGQKGWDVVHFNSRNGLSTDFIYKIFEDSQHRIWLGTDGKGTTLFDGQTFRHFNQSKNNKAFGSVIGIAESPKGTIWLANTEGGIFYGNETVGFEEWQTTNNFTRQSLTGLTTDAFGTVIVLSNHGIEFINPTTRSRALFGSELGLTTFESGINPFSFTASSDLWFATSTDLVRMPSLLIKPKLRPTPILRGVKILMENVDFDNITSFSHNQNYITFEIEGIWHTHPQAVRYRYRLDGLDPDWQTTKEHNLTYPNLPAGTYIFRLQASQSDDFTNAEEVTYTFTIEKPLWQRIWFILLMALIFSGLGFLFIKKREERLNFQAELKREKIESQLEMLKSQISPHFLFNSFNTLIATIENDPKSAVEYTERLSDFYRNILQVREKNTISLQEELNLLENYIFLLRQRHGDAISVEIKTVRFDKKIVPLTLQLLVENAVKHNVVSKSRPLSISILELEDGYLEVKNNVRKKLDKERSTGFGLSSLKSRYQLLTPQKVSVTETEESFIVKIPLI